MKKISILTILALGLGCLTITSCNKKNTFTLEGCLENGANKTIYIEELTPEGALFLDSIYLDEYGEFKYKYTMPYQSIYNVHTTNLDYVVLAPQSGEKIKMTGDYKRLQWNYSIKGSPESILLLQLQQYTNDGITLLTELVNELDHNDSLLAMHKISEKEYYEAKAITDSIYLETYKEQQSRRIRRVIYSYTS